MSEGSIKSEGPVFEDLFKKNVKEIVDEELKDREEKEKKEGVGAQSKLAATIQQIKERRQGAIPGAISDDAPASVPTLVPPYPGGSPGPGGESAHIEDIITCPTCHTGHVHYMQKDGVAYKCNGPKCGKEFIMVDKTADYKCAGCGAPIKKPEDDKLKMDACPFCHGKKATKFDWGKMWRPRSLSP